MPQLIIPLAGNPNQRFFGSNISMSVDQIISGMVPMVVTDGAKGTKTIYLQKRCGWGAETVTSDVVATAIHQSPSTGQGITAFGASGSTIFSALTNCGTLAFTAGSTHTAMHISEIVIGDVTYYMISAHNNNTSLTVTSGWYLASDAFAATSYTGDTHSNTTVDNLSSIAGLYVGQLWAGSGIPADTRIASITAPSTITITNAATATASGVTFTKTPVALIIDPDFPTRITGAFVELNGLVFIMTQAGRIYQSALNNVASWGASDYVSSDLTTDLGMGLAKIRNTILAFGTSSAEPLVNAGNPVGSVLLSKQGETIGTGARRALSSPFLQSLIASDGFRAAWISSIGGTETSGVWLMDKDGTRNIGTPIINKLLSANSKLAISVFSAMGQSFVHIATATAGAKSLLYSISADMWTDGNFQDQYMLSGAPSTTSAAGGLVRGVSMATGNSGGALLNLNESATQDSNAVVADVDFAWTVTTDRYSPNNGEPFYIDSLDLLADKNPGPGVNPNGAVTVTATETDYQNFVSLGSIDMQQVIRTMDGLGWFPSSVAFKLTRTDRANDRLQALVVNWSPA